MKYIHPMFKFLKKKSPQEAIREDLSQIEIGNKAINLGELLAKYDRDILLDVLQQEVDAGKLKGKLIGRKGWFLPGANNFLDQAWSKLLRERRMRSINTKKLWKNSSARLLIKRSCPRCSRPSST